MTDPTDPPATRLVPPGPLRQGTAAMVLTALPGARAVGGVVRDLLAGRAVHDVDIAAPLPPEAVAARLRRAGLKVFETGLKHGTVTAVLDHQPVEVTSLRRDLDTDGRHASVAWTTDWREDAARRDFTINAMSMDAEGRLWDYFGGRDDLAAGRVRFVGEPRVRLAEDYLRLLRFFRFHARYGRGEPDPAALAAIRAALPGLARLSAERVWMELKRLLAAEDPPGAALAALAPMRDQGVLAALLPEAGARADLAPLARLLAIAPSGPAADSGSGPMLRLAALLPPEGGTAAALAARLRFSGEEAKRLRALLETSPPAPDLREAALRRWLAELPPGLAADRALLAEARDGADRAALRARIAATPRPVFPLQGRDVLALGVAPGPALGQALAAARRWWVEDGCRASAEESRAALAGLLRSTPGGGVTQS